MNLQSGSPGHSPDDRIGWDGENRRRGRQDGGSRGVEGGLGPAFIRSN